MNVKTRLYQYCGIATSKLAPLSAAAALIISGCAPSIMNAGDLAAWVRVQAIKQGCQRETIELDEWYTETADGNVWHGTCRNPQDDPKSLGINVDRVWKPSETTN